MVAYIPPARGHDAAIPAIPVGGSLPQRLPWWVGWGLILNALLLAGTIHASLRAERASFDIGWQLQQINEIIAYVQLIDGHLNELQSEFNNLNRAILHQEITARMIQPEARSLNNKEAR